MKSFLSLIRYPNIGIIAITQCLLHFFVLPALHGSVSLSVFTFLCFVGASVFIAAGGYIINDLMDVEIDIINKPQKVIIPEKISRITARRLYLIFTLGGIFMGFYVALSIKSPLYTLFFVGVALLLYIYAIKLKAIPLIGNLVVAGLVATSILLLPIFDISINTESSQQIFQTEIFNLVLNYSIFAFIINLIREIVKDIEDVNGDKTLKINTLPILIGRDRTKNITLIISVLLLLLIAYYIYIISPQNIALGIYLSLFCMFPMLYFCYQLNLAESKKHYSKLSLYLKIIMLLGIASLLFYIN